MDYSNIIIAACSVISIIITMFIFLGKKFEKIDMELKEIRKDISRLDTRISNIEGQITQMTRPVFRIISNEGSEIKEN